jgi:hypothetical protein
MRRNRFPMQTRGLFHPGRESEELHGGVQRVRRPGKRRKRMPAGRTWPVSGGKPEHAVA